MKSETRIFDQVLREYTAPALQVFGLAFDGKRTFHLMSATGKILEIEFQLGVRSMEGLFTVNVSISRSERSIPTVMRLGLLCIPSQILFLGDLIYRNAYLLRCFGGRKDRWWPMPSSIENAKKVQKDVVKLINLYAMAWFKAQRNNYS